MNKKLFLEDDRFLDFITGLAFFSKNTWKNGSTNVILAQLM